MFICLLMFDYLQQFNNLPKNLRDQVSSPRTMALILELEEKYKVDLAIVVMKIMVKSLSFSNLPLYLSGELSLTPDAADHLIRDLKEKIFAPLADYLGLTSAIRALDLNKDIEVIIKAAGLILPSAVAVSRFKNIIATYVRGVRNKIDTRGTLAKDVKIGGLNLSSEEIDRVLKICDTRVSKDSIVAPAAAPAARVAPKAPLVAPAASEYNLKQALARGETKSVVRAPLDTSHELAGSKAQLDLPKPMAPVAPLKPTVGVKTINPVSSPASHLESLRPSAPKIAPAAPAAPVSLAAARTLAGRQAPAPSNIRPQMHDIKPLPKVMGPIEELQFLDVVNFRRLAATPPEITSKILAKIKLLEKDGYDKMVAGVRAWRQSPASRLYLRLGQEAIAQGRPLKEIIDARQNAGQDYLSLDEIKAVVSLNSQLMF
ncbi:MAG: hypothetical protein Q8N57_00865 [bacterium]|nr:hypothetical protein [bacterium]